MNNASLFRNDSSGRVWLNCYYAATGPMRTSLELKPLSLSATGNFSAMTASQLQARDQVLSAAYGCTSIVDDRSWLDCYYGAAQPLRAELGLSPAPQSVPHVDAASPAESSLGIPPPSQGPLPTSEHIVSRMVNYSRGAHSANS